MTMKTEQDFLEDIDKSLVDAANILELSDLSDDLDEEECESIYEARHHCGTCQVRTVMETVWPSVEKYIEWLSTSK